MAAVCGKEARDSWWISGPQCIRDIGTGLLSSEVAVIYPMHSAMPTIRAGRSRIGVIGRTAAHSGKVSRAAIPHLRFLWQQTDCPCLDSVEMMVDLSYAASPYGKGCMLQLLHGLKEASHSIAYVSRQRQSLCLATACMCRSNQTKVRRTDSSASRKPAKRGKDECTSVCWSLETHRLRPTREHIATLMRANPVLWTRS